MRSPEREMRLAWTSVKAVKMRAAGFSVCSERGAHHLRGVAIRWKTTARRSLRGLLGHPHSQRRAVCVFIAGEGVGVQSRLVAMAGRDTFFPRVSFVVLSVS